MIVVKEIRVVAPSLDDPASPPVHQQDVRIAVAVVVDKRAARAHGLGKPLLSEGAVVVGEMNPGLGRDVAKLILRLGGAAAKTMQAQDKDAEAIRREPFLSMQVRR